MRRQIKAKPAGAQPCGVTSATARRVLQSLERMSSPLAVSAHTHMHHCVLSFSFGSELSVLIKTGFFLQQDARRIPTSASSPLSTVRAPFPVEHHVIISQTWKYSVNTS